MLRAPRVARRQSWARTVARPTLSRHCHRRRLRRCRRLRLHRLRLHRLRLHRLRLRHHRLRLHRLRHRRLRRRRRRLCPCATADWPWGRVRRRRVRAAVCAAASRRWPATSTATRPQARRNRSAAVRTHHPRPLSRRSPARTAAPYRRPRSSRPRSLKAWRRWESESSTATVLPRAAAAAVVAVAALASRDPLAVALAADATGGCEAPPGAARGRRCHRCPRYAPRPATRHCHLGKHRVPVAPACAVARTTGRAAAPPTPHLRWARGQTAHPMHHSPVRPQRAFRRGEFATAPNARPPQPTRTAR